MKFTGRFEKIFNTVPLLLIFPRNFPTMLLLGRESFTTKRSTLLWEKLKESLYINKSLPIYIKIVRRLITVDLCDWPNSFELLSPQRCEATSRITSNAVDCFCTLKCFWVDIWTYLADLASQAEMLKYQENKLISISITENWICFCLFKK